MTPTPAATPRPVLPSTLTGCSAIDSMNVTVAEIEASIQRLEGAKDASFVSLVEGHGRYDASSETTVGSRSAIRALRHARTGDADLITIELVNGRTVTLAIADDARPGVTHRSNDLRWAGHIGRFDGVGEGAKQ